MYTGKLCFIIEFIAFYGKVEIYLGLKLIKENQFMSLFSFFFMYTYRFVNSVVTVILWIPYYYQSYKIPNKKQTDFQNLSHQKFTLYIYEKCSPVRIPYAEKPHHCFVSSKILQLKIYLRSFYDLLLLLRTDYSVTMTSHQGKKKMASVIFLLSTEISEMLF